MAISIGIRELRQHASRYFRRVRAGETITVTDRGEPFAEIRPMQRRGSAADQLIAAGRATPASSDLAEFIDLHPPVLAQPGEPLLSELVIAMRGEERP